MLVLLLGLFLKSTSSQTVCNSDVVLYDTTCPSGQTALDCAYLSQNSAALCEFMDLNTVGNGPSCSLYSNCTYASIQAQTTSIFCCALRTASGTASPVFVNPSYSAVPTTTCPYRFYDASTDFSSNQGSNGWYYGYYNSGTFTQFSNYGVGSSMSVGAVNSWNYNSASNGMISSNMIMPNGGGSCNTASYGNVAPVLRWYNPVGSCYSDVTVTLFINRPSGSGTGVTVAMTFNGLTVYSGSLVAVTSFTQYFNGYGVNSIELSVSPNNNNCDFAQITYGLMIRPMGPSGTVSSSRSPGVSGSNLLTGSSRRSLSGSVQSSKSVSVSMTRSGSPSISNSPRPSLTGSITGNATSTGVSSSSRLTSSSMRTLSASPKSSNSVSVSMTRSGSPSISNSPRPSNTNSITATATSTVFYDGNWTDMAHSYYQGADITYMGGLTLNKCKIACWLNPLCAIISVQTPCNNVLQDSPEADTVVCEYCWLKKATGWTSISDYSHIHTFIYYDEVYPPTQSSIATKSSTSSPLPSVTSRTSLSVSGSPRPSTTLKTVFTYNMCADTGNLFLPIVGSYAEIYTNVPGTQYGNGWGCSVDVKGFQPGLMTIITFNTFFTEGGYDFIRIYNSANTMLYSFSGTAIPSTLYISDYVRITFNSDGSNVGTGVVFSVMLGLATPSASASVSSSALPSISTLRTASNSRSISTTARETRLNSPSASVSYSRFASYTPSASNTSNAAGFTKTNSFTVSSTALESHSRRNTESFISSNSFNSTNSLFKTDSGTVSQTNSASASSSPSFSSSVSVSESPSLSSSSSVSTSYYFTYSLALTASPTSSPAPSPSGYGSPSISSSSTTSLTSSGSALRSKTPVKSVSSSYSKSLCQTASMTPFLSRTATSSLTLSKTPTASYLMRPKLKTAPALPADLSLMSSDQLSSAITDLGNYDPSLVKDNLQILGAAALFKMDGPLTISTDTFALTMTKLGNESANPISTEGLDAVLPVIPVVGAAATSVIKWAANPYPNTTVIDSPVVSMSVINMGGSAVSVSNLSVPIRMNWNLNIDDSDPRLAKPPSYMAVCLTGDIFTSIGVNGPMTKMSISGPGLTSWLVPCLMGSKSWVNCSSGDSVKNFNCPPANIVPRCMYWSKKLGAWAEDGCVAVSGNASSIICECTHLTDFSARLDSVVAENTKVFNNAANVYSLEGLIKYAKWYGIFGGIGLMTLILGALVTRVDYISTQKYITAVCLNEDVSNVLKSVPNTPIFAYDAFSTLKETDRKIKHKFAPPHLNICMRILIQHSRLQFLFRYDPRLNRLFRLLGILLLQFHSLFITALFYGFTYGAGGKSAMQWYDIILLAGLTTALNLPVVRFLFTAMNQVGLEEFKVQFPILYAEYVRRVEFEHVALEYLKRKRGMELNDEDKKEETDTITNEVSANDDEEEVLVDTIMFYLCCREKKKVDSEDLSEQTLHQLMRRMATLIKESYPYIEAYPNSYGMLPFHTRGGLLYTLFSMGWIAWCLNYLLLFAAAHSNEVGENIMITYATSEITTVFLTQPLIIAISYVFYKGLNAYGKYLPEWLHKRLVVRSVNAIPSLYYFSDPLGKKAKTSFSSEFSYNIFVRCPAASMGATEQSYAPQKALAAGDIPPEKTIVVEIKKLYNTFIGTWDEIMQR